MSQYLLIRILLLTGLAVIAWVMMRPARSASHIALRRMATLAIMALAVVAIAYPPLLNNVAHALGVERGINLLVYLLVLGYFAQVVTAHRREIDSIRRMTAIARAQALTTVQFPDAHDDDRPKERE